MTRRVPHATARVVGQTIKERGWRFTARPTLLSYQKTVFVQHLFFLGCVSGARSVTYGLNYFLLSPFPERLFRFLIFGTPNVSSQNNFRARPNKKSPSPFLEKCTACMGQVPRGDYFLSPPLTPKPFKTSPQTLHHSPQYHLKLPPPFPKNVVAAILKYPKK